MSIETAAPSSAVRSRMKLKRPFFRRKSGQSGETPSLSGGLPTTPTSLRMGSTNSTPLAVNALHRGPFSPPLMSATPTEMAPPFPKVPPHLAVDFDVAKQAAALLVSPAMLALQQLAPSNSLSMAPYRSEPRTSISTAASQVPHESPSDALASQVSLPESGTASITSAGAVPQSTTPSHQSISHLFSGEQLSASALAVPAASFAALYRTFRNLHWLAEHASVMRKASLDILSCAEAQIPFINNATPSSFDLCVLVQAVADTLAAQAAQRGVELIIYHSGNTSDETGREAMHIEASLAEIIVRADESLIMLALLTLLQEVMLEAPAGSSIEINLSARPPAVVSLAGHGDTESLNESVASSSAPDGERKSWSITLEILRTVPRQNGPLSAIDAEELAGVKQVAATTLHLAGFALSRDERPSSSHQTTYRLQAELPMARVKPTRGRLGSAESGKEPSRRDLIRFADSTLKGKKVVFHASERSLFAQHITDFFASWGTDISYSSIDAEDLMPSTSSARSEDSHTHAVRQALGRYDSGFASASDSSPSSAPMLSPMEQTAPAPHPLSSLAGSRISPVQPSDVPAVDPSVHFIVIDDNVPTLRRQLTAIRNNPPMQPHMQSTLLSKRPQLQSRRTRSSAHIRTAGVPHALCIIHFTSLANFRTIKDVVRGILRSASPLFPLPDVLVIPKPVGPRRLLTALHTAVRRPHLDPAFAPIATSPASPGGHYFFAGSSGSPRPSPAAVERHYDFSEAPHQSPEHAAGTGEAGHTSPAISGKAASGTSPHGSAPPTPPGYLFASQPQAGGQPTPLQSSDALEYFSSTAATLSAGGASGGIVIQSPDGKPTGLFFQPTKSHRSSGRRSSVEQTTSVAMSREKEMLLRPIARTVSGVSAISPPLSKATIGDAEQDIDLPPLRAADTFASAMDDTDRSPLPTPPGSDDEETAGASAKKQTADDLGLVTPQHLGLGHVGRTVSEPMSVHLANHDQSSPPLRAVRLEAYPVNSPKDMPPPLHRMPTAPAKIPTMQLSTGVSSSPPGSPLKQSTSHLAGGSGSPTPATPKALPSPTITQPTEVQTSAPREPESAVATVSEAASVVPEVKQKQQRQSAGLRAAKKKSKPIKKPRSEAMVPPINVLIVEDNRINQTILSTFMKRKGIRYGVAANGQEAVDMWKTGGYHLVLMDIQLPIKSGIEATVEIRELERVRNIGTFVQTPTAELGSPFGGAGSSTTKIAPTTSSPYGLPVIIVALTASSDSADRVAALAAGCNDFLTKPVGLPWLQQKLLEWGSMQLLAGFPRRQISRSVDQSAENSEQRQFDVSARAVAGRLHLEPRANPRVLSGTGASKKSIQQILKSAGVAKRAQNTPVTT